MHDQLHRHAVIRGWIKYYGAFYKSALYPALRHLDPKLALWATRKFKRLRRHRRQTRSGCASWRSASLVCWSEDG